MGKNLREEILGDVEKCRKKHGRITRDLYRKVGKYSERKLYKEFGSWGGLVSEFIGDEDSIKPKSRDLTVDEMRSAIRDEYISLSKKLGKNPTTRDWDRHASFSKRQLYNAFSSISELKEYSNLTTEKNLPPKISKQLLITEKKNHTKIYTEELLSYAGKYNRSKKTDHKTLMVGADWHDKWVDPFALEVWLDTVKRVQPDYINFAGDVFDFYEVSTFSKDPRRIFSLQKEIDFVVKKIFKPTREAAPNAQIDLLIGNHEFRLIKFLMAEAQALSSLRCLRFGQLFQLDECEINIVCHDRFDKNANLNKDRNYIVYDDLYLVTHGTNTGNNHAMGELQKWGISGCSGHVHHHQEAKIFKSVRRQSKKDLHGDLKWVSLGCMCKISSGYEYIFDIPRWQQGFNVVHIFPKHNNVINEYVEIIDNKAIAGGKFYERR